MSRPLPPRPSRMKSESTSVSADRIDALIERVLSLTDIPPHARYVELVRSSSVARSSADLPDRFKLGVGDY